MKILSFRIPIFFLMQVFCCIKEIIGRLPNNIFFVFQLLHWDDELGQHHLILEDILSKKKKRKKNLERIFMYTICIFFVVVPSDNELDIMGSLLDI